MLAFVCAGVIKVQQRLRWIGGPAGGALVHPRHPQSRQRLHAPHRHYRIRGTRGQSGSFLFTHK